MARLQHMEVEVPEISEDFIERVALKVAEKAAERAAEAAAEKVMARYEERIMVKVNEKLQRSEEKMFKAFARSLRSGQKPALQHRRLLTPSSRCRALDSPSRTSSSKPAS